MLRNRHLILGLALLLASSLNSFGQSQEPSPSSGDGDKPQQAQSKSGQQKGATDNRGTAQSPLIVRSIKGDEEAAKDEQDRKDKAFNDSITIFLSAAVAIGTLLQFSALVVIIRTTRRQLRAYIGVAVHNSPEIKAGAIPRAILICQNHGQTPARDVRYWADICVEPYPSNPRFEPNPLSKERFTVPPTGIEYIDVCLEETFTQPVVDMIDEDNARIYVYGEIWYFDIFGSEWRTEFRLMKGKHMMAIRGMARCAKGNSAT